MNTEQRTVWITGGASGIGRATARALAADGARVVVSDRDEAGLESLATEAAVVVEPLDVSHSDDVSRVASRILETYGRLDALVNCAGINVPERHLDLLTIDGWDRVVGINLSGVYYCCHAVLPHMRANGSRHDRDDCVLGGAEPRLVPGRRVQRQQARAARAGGDDQPRNGRRGSAGDGAPARSGRHTDPPAAARREMPPAEVRAKMLRPEDVAAAIAWILSLPPHVCVNELQISPTSNYHYAGMRPASAVD